MIINKNIQQLTENVKNGKIICFKTDTIWGLSANPNNKECIQNLYKLKQRELDKPFIFLISKNQNLNKLVESISSLEQKLIDNFWPGPLTIIFKAKENLPILSHYNNQKTIALRMPDDPLTQHILSGLDFPLPSTSVNLQNKPPLNDFNEIYSNFNNTNINILKDFTNFSQNASSTIVSVENNKINILREGQISKEKILSILT